MADAASAGRIAVVPTRYGDGVIGGSEDVMRELAHGLAKRGWDAHVLTTCARSHYDWRNEYPAGLSQDGAVTVHRFPTVQDGDKTRRDVLEGRIQLGLPISPDEQQAWLHGNVRVPELFHHLVASSDRYDAIVLSPYLFWTTATCWRIEPEKTVVMPCFHDEHYAYLDLFQPLLSDVGQLWFLAEPEHELAHRLVSRAPGDPSLAPHRTTGAGIIQPAGYDPDGFRARTGLGQRPFVYYGGRREEGKGWPQLLGAFTRAVLEYGADLDLVTSGVGPVLPSPAVAGRVHDLGLVASDDLPHVFAAASAYVQPSWNESFSRTIMEAWLAGTGVIANAASAVVSWHCRRSGAGVLYEHPEELVQALVLLAADPGMLEPLAARGRDYVVDEYSPSLVLDRMEEGLRSL